MATSDMRVLAKQRRNVRIGKELPEGFLETIREMMSRPYHVADIPPALGITWQTFVDRRKSDDGAIDAAIAAGRARLHEELVGPLYERATKEGDVELTKWLLARFFDTYNINQRRAIEAANIDQKIVNVINLPAAMTPDQYRDLLQATQMLPNPSVIDHDAA